MRSPDAATVHEKFDPNVDEVPWVTEGITAGLLGATTIAVFFFVVDLLLGRPLATPNALGAALFLGAHPEPGAAPRLVLVVGYTALHGGVFVVAGLLAAFELLTGSRIPGTTTLRRSLVLGLLLFAFFEIVFRGFAHFVGPIAVEILGSGRVELANLLAAAAMAGFLLLRGERLGLHPEGDDTPA